MIIDLTEEERVMAEKCIATYHLLVDEYCRSELLGWTKKDALLMGRVVEKLQEAKGD